MKALIAEDDLYILQGLERILRQEGYETATARDGREALRLFEADPPDFVCLDIMMPGESGYSVCEKIRKHDPGIPIIFITAKSEEIDRVKGLDLGADDFIAKPFGVQEVAARVRAVARRCMARPGRNNHLTLDRFTMGDLEIVPSELRAHRGKESIDLSLRDVKILELLHRHRGKALDRHTIFCHVWGVDHMPNSRTLDQHVSQLRKRIEIDARTPAIVETVHGVGYRFEG